MVCLSPQSQIIKYFAPFLFSFSPIPPLSLSVGCVKMSGKPPSSLPCADYEPVFVRGPDSNGLVITVCLWVYRCIPPPCLRGLWATADKDHTFIFTCAPTLPEPPSPEDGVSSYCELPLWSYYKAQYFWSRLVWVRGMNLTWLCNLEMHKI